MNDWTDTGSYAYNTMQRENAQLREQNTMLDRIAAEYEDTVSQQAKRIAADEALLRRALEALESVFEGDEKGAQYWTVTGGTYEAIECKQAIATLRERLGHGKR